MTEATTKVRVAGSRLHGEGADAPDTAQGKHHGRKDRRDDDWHQEGEVDDDVWPGERDVVGSRDSEIGRAAA